MITGIAAVGKEGLDLEQPFQLLTGFSTAPIKYLDAAIIPVPLAHIHSPESKAR